jgi:hypothetical protein
MQKIIKPTIVFFLAGSVFLLMAFTAKKKKAPKPEKQKIQVAILLDVSNSMDGLIEQAKAQLWNMVSVLGKAKCADVSPDVEIALYEYGRSSNDVKQGYVKQINGFINNLDSLSENLFNLTTNGGDEYCGQVIYKSLDELKWDQHKGSYKVIFIAGNEDFLQGTVKYTEGCTKAKENGVIINTIYCGDRDQGIKEHWNLGAECGTGSFTNINPNAVIENIPTPYDSTLYTLNSRLNETYIRYGELGLLREQKQKSVDEANASMNKSVFLKRASAKGQSNVYRNDSWDLVDGLEKDAKLLDKVDVKTLPEPLRNKSKTEIKKIVQENAQTRASVQKEIGTTSAKRDAYLVDERKRRAEKNKGKTLESEMEKILIEQAAKFKMEIQ